MLLPESYTAHMAHHSRRRAMSRGGQLAEMAVGNTLSVGDDLDCLFVATGARQSSAALIASPPPHLHQLPPPHPSTRLVVLHLHSFATCQRHMAVYSTTPLHLEPTLIDRGTLEQFQASGQTVVSTWSNRDGSLAVFPSNNVCIIVLTRAHDTTTRLCRSTHISSKPRNALANRCTSRNHMSLRGRRDGR